MDAGFLVNGEPVSSGFGERRNKFVRSFNHEMTIERDFQDSAKRSHDGRPDGYVGNKVAVHNVDVQNGRSAINCRLHLLAESGEVSGKNRGGPARPCVDSTRGLSPF